MNVVKKISAIFIALSVLLPMSLTTIPSSFAHGIESHNTTIVKPPPREPKISTIPSGKGLPAGVTRVYDGKRYQWNGHFWKLMSKATWPTQK